ncbi:hypothetical protein GGR56DRAFT_678800 [Xylariaceae sp. FL0804]|nr:hypothetical protein GGR56DRAFT_678800 [Xylariaceae sp. FL0804]
MRFQCLLHDALALASLAAASPASRPAPMGSSGTKGYLTRDDRLAKTTTQSDKTAAVADSALAVGSNSITTCTTNTTATVADCEVVIASIAGNTDGIEVPAGFCFNWDSETCTGRVCGTGQTISISPQWVADTMTDPLLDKCVAGHQSGVAADCDDWAGTCGTYRLLLEGAS